MYFEKLNEYWRAAFDAGIYDVDEALHPFIAEAFKEYHSRTILEREFPAIPSQDDRFEIAQSYIDFSAGWEASAQHVAAGA